MKHLSITFLALYVFSSTVFSQVVFEKTFGGINNETGYYIFQTTDNGYIISADTAGYSTDENFYLIKLDSVGNTQWIKSIGDTSDEVALCVKQSQDGGYIFVGNYNTSTNGDFALILKTDANGDSLWSLISGGTLGTRYAVSVVQAKDGGYIMSSVDDGTVWNNPYQIIKVDSGGNYLWQGDDMISSTYFGGYGSSLQKTFDNGFVITGTFKYNMQTQDRMQLSKADTRGHLQWVKIFYGMLQCESYSVWQNVDSSYIIAGSTNSFGIGGYDIYIIKTNSAGDSLWAKTFGGANDESISAIQQTADGGYIVIATTSSVGAGLNDIELLKLNQNGDSIWAKTFGGTDNELAFHGAQCTDGGYIIVGSTKSFGNGGSDIYVIKTDSAGNLLTTINEQKNISQVEIFPNPFFDHITINKTCTAARLTNILGQQINIHWQNSAGESMFADTRALHSGIYILEVTATSGTITRKKLGKQ